MVCDSVAEPSIREPLTGPEILINDEKVDHESNDPKDKKDIDYIYDKIVGGGSTRDFGQWVILVALISVSFVSSWPMFINLFAGLKPRHRCFVPNCDTEETMASMVPDWISAATPTNVFSNSKTCQVEMVKTDEEFDSCNKYQTIIENMCKIESFNQSGTEKCSSYVYDNSVVIESFVTKFDLVCDKEYVNRVFRGIMVFGLFIGCGIGGYLADRFGRKRVMLLSTLVIVPNVMFAGYSPNIWVYGILLFIMTITCPIIWTSIGTITSELFGRDHRSTALVAEGLSWSFGSLLSVLVFYLTRHWTYLHIWIGALSTLALPAFLIIPESPRWLVVQAKCICAEQVLLKIARWNRRNLSNEDIDEIRSILENVERDAQIGQDEKLSFRMLLVENDWKKTWILTLNWGVLCASYYTLLLNVTELSGNVFFNSVLLATLGNFPGKLSVGLTLKHISRRINLMGYHFLAGTFFVILGLIPKHFTIGVMIFYLLAMICIEAGFSAINLVTREIYPTNIRNQAVGVFMALSRIFAIVSPFISKLSCIWKPLPMLIIGLAYICVSCLSYYLPETKYKNLTESNYDADESKKFRSMKSKSEPIPLNDNQIV